MIHLRSRLLRMAACFSALIAAAGCGGVEEGLDPDDSAFGAASCHGAPYPILLAHGMAGWNRVGPWDYYYQVAADLRGRGEQVIVSQVSPFESSAVRGRQLAQAISDALRSTGACKINVIAHSQGGLDARYAISSLGYGNRVASLVTVSTPHRGSPVADVALGLIPGFSFDVINAVISVYQNLIGGPGSPNLQANLTQLSRPYLQNTFNPQNPDDSRVAYYSVAGRSAGRIANESCAGVWQNPQRFDVLDPLMLGSQLVFAAVSPNPLSPLLNDGLVTVESARWGRFLGCVPADHLDEIGQFFEAGTDLISGFNHKELYRRIIAQLRQDRH